MNAAQDIDDDPPPPPGVTLRDPDDTVALRKSMEEKVVGAFGKYVNGYKYGGVRLELENIHLADKETYSLKEQNEYKMRDKFLARRIRADVRLVDDVTNELIDHKKKFTLGRLPYLTDDRGTIIHNGSEYSPIHQMRLLPGVYARKTQSGELESHFNTRPGTGPVMRVGFNPETAQYNVQIGKANLHAYSFFNGIGVTDEELEKRWGKPVLEANKSRFDKGVIARAYTRVVPKWERDDSLSNEEKVAAVRKALDSAQVSETVLRRNLPNLFDSVKSASWRAVGIMFDNMDQIEKNASCYFAPDLKPDQAGESILDFDFDSLIDVEKAASADEFYPDFSADDIKDATNAIYGGRGPRLASMKSWPAKWLDDQDNMGWLQWYENYNNGRRSDTDDKQINRWKSFKRRHGAQFITNPTPRRAFALRNWAIDPLKLLPEDRRADVSEAMDKYKNTEHAKWAMRRAKITDDAKQRLLRMAKDRGFESEDDGDSAIIAATEDSKLTAKDFMEFVV